MNCPTFILLAVVFAAFYYRKPLKEFADSLKETKTPEDKDK